MPWKSPFITRWVGFRNRNRPTVSARENQIHGNMLGGIPVLHPCKPKTSEQRCEPRMKGNDLVEDAAYFESGREHNRRQQGHRICPGACTYVSFQVVCDPLRDFRPVPLITRIATGFRCQQNFPRDSPRQCLPRLSRDRCCFHAGLPG